MIFIDKMKNFKIYRTKTFLPTIKGNKKKNSAVLMMTPNFDSSKRLMNNEMFVNSGRYESYYIEKDVSFYINSKVVEEVDEAAIIKEQSELDICLESKRSELKDSDFGVSSKRKFPLDSEAHTRSAVKFFNYVDPEDEEELAKKLISAINKYDIDDINISEKNRFSKYYNPKKSITESAKIKKCKFCGSNNIGVYIKGEPVYICKDCSKYLGVVPFKEEYEIDNNAPEVDIIKTETLLKNLPESSLNLGDKVMFFNEANNPNDAQLKRLLYNYRLRYRKDVISMLDTVKKDVSWIKYAFPELNRYMKRNIFVDLYYYNSIFFEHNSWILKRGFNLYLDFMNRLLNHPNLKSNGYTYKTIFIPVIDWDKTHDGMIWNYRRSINPISCIYQLMFEGRLNDLKKTFGNIDVVFVGKNNYFKVNFSQIDAKDLKKFTAKFKLFCIKICTGEDFAEEDIDSTADHKEDTEVITAKIVDKIEKSKGIDLTQHLAKSTIKLAKKKTDYDSDEYRKTVKYSFTSYDPSDITIQNAKTKKDIEKIANDLEDNVDYYETDEEDNERTAAINKLSDAIASASEESDSEEDALDMLDNYEIDRILISLGNDDEVNISAARSTRMSNLDTAIMDKEMVRV